VALVKRVDEIILVEYFAKRVTCLQENKVVLDTRLHSRVPLLDLLPYFKERTQAAMRQNNAHVQVQSFAVSSFLTHFVAESCHVAERAFQHVDTIILDLLTEFA